jgi:Holliday junction resolvasome RuvABC ATP-dependent DNA helicase subunit
LTKNKSLGSEKIKDHLKVTFENWKGKLEQVDDVLVIGIKL